MTRLSDLGGASPDAALCVQALETITSSVLKTMQSLSFRINLVRASLHLDTQLTPAKVGRVLRALVDRTGSCVEGVGSAIRNREHQSLKVTKEFAKSKPRHRAPRRFRRLRGNLRVPNQGQRLVASLQRSFASGFMKAKDAGVARSAGLLTIGTRFQSRIALTVAWRAAEKVTGRMRAPM